MKKYIHCSSSKTDPSPDYIYTEVWGDSEGVLLENRKGYRAYYSKMENFMQIFQVISSMRIIGRKSTGFK